MTDAVQELEVAQKIIKEELSEDTSEVTTTIGPGTEGTNVVCSTFSFVWPNFRVPSSRALPLDR
jgi:hypothetical protein